MLATYLFKTPVTWIVPLIFQILSYYKILGKMGKRKAFAIIPILGEMEMSTDLFRRMRSFWRPAAIIVALFFTSRYIGIDTAYGKILALVALIVYGIFLMRLYWRLARQFGRSRFFAVGLILMPLVFLLILGFGRSRYQGKPYFEPEKPMSRTASALRKALVVAVSVLELAVLLIGCFYITIMVHPFRAVTQYLMNDTISTLSSVTETEEITGRDITIGADFAKVADAQRTRDYYFPDHSGDKKVVVMEYIIGSNLEDARGSATVNIAQMKDATEKGDGLEFVLQTGGSDRWFTKGIDDASVGRYVISGGELEKVKALDRHLCMSEPDNLRDFIVWTKENYPADRYMLVLWDHGGGFSLGFGSDDLNKRATNSGLISASEMIGAIKDAGVKFDLIGFDACLMQNIEYANAFEPFADYYLASEESEPGTGWFYTAGFGKLAEDPTMSTEEFGKAMINTYDQCNRAYNSGKIQPQDTLSLVDLTLIRPVYEQVESLYDTASSKIADEPAVFSNISAARSGAYQFNDEEQVDLVSFLNNLKQADYKQQVVSDDTLDAMAQTAKACVVYRNSDSADGINGIAIDIPYSQVGNYTEEYEQLKSVGYTSERGFLDKFCSIMASQRMRASQNDDSFFGTLFKEDYTDEPWYTKGFEDYDTTSLFVDIPVKKLENGYLPELPAKTWDILLDCEVAGYIVTDEGLMYIGREHFAEDDGNGHPLVSMDGMWVHVNGQLACYETDSTMVTEDGIIYTGTVRARLNGKEDITMHIEWDPATEEGGEVFTGTVTGYSTDEKNSPFFMKKGLEQFETGDTLEFLFDFYNEEGEFIKTDVYGDKMHVISDGILTVSDEMLESGTELEYFGVLIDVYQRELMTEAIREQVE